MPEPSKPHHDLRIENEALRRQVAALRAELAQHEAHEDARRESEERLRLHTENTPLAVIEWGPDMRLCRWSQGAVRIFGWQAEEVLGRRLDEFRWVHEEDLPQVASRAAQIFSGACRQFVGHNRNYHKDGSVVYCAWYNSVLLDSSQHLRSVLSLVLDVTERVQTQKALETSKDRLQFALESSQTGVWGLDMVHHTITHTREHDRIFGYTDATPQWTYETFLTHVLPEDRALVDSRLQRAVQDGSDYRCEFRIRRPDGTVRWAFAAGRLVADPQLASPRMAGIIRDITEQKLAEESAGQSAQRYRMLVETLPDAVVMADPQLRVIFASRQALALCGATDAAAVNGRPLWEFIVEEQRSRVFDGMENFFKTGLVRRAIYTFCRFDGSRLPCELSATAVRDAEGQITAVIAVVRDMTEQMQIQEALAQERLALLEARHAAEAANQAKTTFLANMSHEIRTPLTVILGFADLLLQERLPASQRRAHLRAIRDNGRMLLALLGDILDLSLVEAGEMTITEGLVD